MISTPPTPKDTHTHRQKGMTARLTTLIYKIQQRRVRGGLGSGRRAGKWGNYRNQGGDNSGIVQEGDERGKAMEETMAGGPRAEPLAAIPGCRPTAESRSYGGDLAVGMTDWGGADGGSSLSQMVKGDPLCNSTQSKNSIKVPQGPSLGRYALVSALEKHVLAVIVIDGTNPISPVYVSWGSIPPVRGRGFLLQLNQFLWSFLLSVSVVEVRRNKNSRIAVVWTKKTNKTKKTVVWTVLIFYI